MSNNNQIMDWYYKYDADITYGEIHVSKVPKILLILLSILIISVGVVSYIYRDYIYDLITNPQLELIKEVKQGNENIIQLEVNDPNFNPMNYVNNILNPDDLKFTYEIEDNVNIHKVGNYNIVYRSANNVYSQEQNLVVKVVDSTPPVIKLKDSSFDSNLEYNEVTNTTKLSLIYEYEDKHLSVDALEKSFDPTIYIESIFDNYTPVDKLKLEYTNVYNFNIPDGKYSITFNIIYKVTDEKGNTGTNALEVTVFENLEAKNARELDKQAQKDKLIKELEALLSATPTPTSTPTPTPTAVPLKPTTVPTPRSTATPTPTVALQGPVVTVDPNEPENTGTPTPTPILEVGEAGIWAGDVTVSLKDIGNDPTGMFLFNECLKQVHYVNTELVGATPINMPGMDVQLKAGKYIVTWTTMDGKLTCEQRVTITE